MEDMEYPLPSLEDSMIKYQKPEEVDKMMRVSISAILRCLCACYTSQHNAGEQEP